MKDNAIVAVNEQGLMKRIKDVIAVALMPVALTFSGGTSAQPPTDPLLSEIASGIESYRTKTITLRLRLRNIDRTFGRIVFYDRKNVDITFDVSDDAMTGRISVDMLNAHEGLEYFVTFTVVKVGALGELVGTLVGFQPVLAEAIPEGKAK